MYKLYSSIKAECCFPFRVSDADVFVIYTHFKNPNIFQFEDIETTECFDSLYLLLKIATHLDIAEKEELRYLINGTEIPLRRKPIFMCDGLIPIDILHTFSTNIPSDSFFCPTAVPAIATSILGDHLKVSIKLVCIVSIKVYLM